jgi:hypothetical protein
MSDSYWTVSSGVASRTGWSCRECRQVIAKGEAIRVRDARKMRFFYHDACFSGDADPRTQASSTFHTGKFSHLAEKAPEAKGHGKWSTSSYGFGRGVLPSAAGGVPASLGARPGSASGSANR